MTNVMTEEHVNQLGRDVFASIMTFIDDYGELNNSGVRQNEQFNIALNVAIAVIQHTSINILLSISDDATPDEVREALSSLADYVDEGIRLPDAWETLKKLRLEVVTHPEIYD